MLNDIFYILLYFFLINSKRFVQGRSGLNQIFGQLYFFCLSVAIWSTIDLPELWIESPLYFSSEMALQYCLPASPNMIQRKHWNIAAVFICVPLLHL